MQLLYYGHPYGIIPLELEDVYPLGQTNVSKPIDEEARETVSKNIKKYLSKIQYRKLTLIFDTSIITERLLKHLQNSSNVKVFDIYGPDFTRAVMRHLLRLK